MIETSADYRGFFLQGKKTFGQFEQSSRVSEVFFVLILNACPKETLKTTVHFISFYNSEFRIVFELLILNSSSKQKYFKNYITPYLVLQLWI